MDIACGDVIHFNSIGKPVVRNHLAKDKVDILCHKEGEDPKDLPSRLRFRTHHLVLAVMDPDQVLFEPVHRFTAFCGYWNRSEREFVRPRDNCFEVEEVLDDEEDGLAGACKTDGEHGLGFGFHSLWAVWRSHHAVNQWFHQIRERAGFWLHALIEEEYAEEQEDREYPSFYQSLPKTLTEEFYEL